jgi:hypothetical protein
MRSSPSFPHNTTTPQAATKPSIFLNIIGLSEFYNGRKKTLRSGPSSLAVFKTRWGLGDR